MGLGSQFLTVSQEIMGQMPNWSVNILFLWNCVALHQLTFKYVVINLYQHFIWDGIRLCRHKPCELKLQVRLEFWHPVIVGCSFPFTLKIFQIKCFVSWFSEFLSKQTSETCSTMHYGTDILTWTAGACGFTWQIFALHLCLLNDPNGPGICWKIEVFARVISRLWLTVKGKLKSWCQFQWLQIFNFFQSVMIPMTGPASFVLIPNFPTPTVLHGSPCAMEILLIYCRSFSPHSLFPL